MNSRSLHHRRDRFPVAVAPIRPAPAQPVTFDAVTDVQYTSPAHRHRAGSSSPREFRTFNRCTPRPRGVATAEMPIA
jgi:hypothetical protein